MIQIAFNDLPVSQPSKQGTLINIAPMLAPSLRVANIKAKFGQDLICEVEGQEVIIVDNYWDDPWPTCPKEVVYTDSIKIITLDSPLTPTARDRI